MLVAPDTSPRGHDVPGRGRAWDFGIGAGFYLDATQAPWAAHWRMESYVTRRAAGADRRELPRRPGSPGHLRPLDGRPWRADAGPAPPRPWRSRLGLRADLRAERCPWGEKAFTGYLGADREPGRSTTPRAVRAPRARALPQLLVDQGLDDKFLAEQLKPELLEAACRGDRPAADAAPPCGLRPLLLVHPDLHGRPLAHHAQALEVA